MMLHRQSGLGRGLGALIPPKRLSPQDLPVDALPEAMPLVPTVPPSLTATDGALCYVPIGQVVANPHQPRKHFDQAALDDLVSSIKEHGVIEPLVVTATPDGRYELVAGERRFRASQLAGLATVPAMVRTATEQQKLEIAIIENVQRQDLNPIEEALAYRRLMDEFGLTQDQVSDKMGKSRPQVANTVRLLLLPQEIQQALVERKISASNARTLLSVASPTEQQELFRAMLDGKFTVRQAEARTTNKRSVAAQQDPNVQDTERRLREALGYRVSLKRTASGSGEIKIAFENGEDFKNIVRKLIGQ
ncbi:MAG: putative chromosome 1-partitioning protein ParB [Candidatus Parcubacteria bacterium]|jgi:ParB family chromosome partitioning protein